MAKTEKHFKCFDTYLDWIGAEKMPKTNPYEEARFIANEIVCVIYRGKKGVSFSNEEARKVLNAFHEKRKINVCGTKRTKFQASTKRSLFERDGYFCFYTNTELTEETATIEHLIPLSKGGKNNLDNLVLCTKESNHEMADRPLIEKIKLREKALYEKRR